MNGQYKKALSKMQQLCSRQEKCKSDIRDKLANYSLDQEDIEKIIAILINDKFIDENRFASFYARDKFRFNKWGKIKISFALKNLGIDSGTITQALAQIDDNEYESILITELQKKNRVIRDEDLQKRKSKLIRFALSRGFENELVYKLVKRLFVYNQ